MYSFEPNEEQHMLLDAVKRFAVNDLRAKAREAEEEGEFPGTVIEKGWELGILQCAIPEEMGGFGDHSVITGVLTAEEMAWGDMAGALTVMTPGLFAIPLLIVGSDEQKKRYLPAISESEWKPYSAALIEPYYDSDPNALRTKAVSRNGHYVLDGVKTCVPFALDAPAMLVYADLDDVTQGFILEQGVEGLHISERQKFMGLNGMALHEVRLENVKVPIENRLGGPEGHDFGLILASMQVSMAAIAVGMSRAALEYAIEYAKDREVFGVKVAQKQVIAFMLAEMATEIEAIRLLNWEAAWMIDRKHEEAIKQAYLAYTGAVDLAMMVTDRAVQVLGGHGYIREHPVELWMRNGRGIAMLNGLAIV